MDKINILAQTLVRHSVSLKPGEKVLIQAIDEASKLTEAVVKEVYAVGAIPFVIIRNYNVHQAMLKDASIEQLQRNKEWEMSLVTYCDAMIVITYGGVRQYPGIKQEALAAYRKEWSSHISEYMTTAPFKWCLTAWFGDEFPLDAYCADYVKMSEAAKPLVQVMDNNKDVRIVSPGTDLKFSIKNIPVVPCCGECNVPDGEVYTAPVKNSINGYITFNIPSFYQNIVFDNIKLEFIDGKIVKAEAGDKTEQLNDILDTDEGSRYIGEFSLGINKDIRKPILDTLFDEKIYGSLHLAVGASYDDAPNDNKSVIHWDLVLIQTPEYGGGEIWFDDKLIRKDGEFVIKELQALNDER